MAYAAAEFTQNLIEAMTGADGKVECAYVRSEESEAKYFASPVLLGVSIHTVLWYKNVPYIYICKMNHMVCNMWLSG